MLAALTAVLIVITAYYAWQTRRAVVEMQRARQLSVRPKLVIAIEMPDPTIGRIAIKNVGAGAALDVDVTLPSPS